MAEQNNELIDEAPQNAEPVVDVVDEVQVPTVEKPRDQKKRPLDATVPKTNGHERLNMVELETALGFAQALAVSQPDDLVGGGTSVDEPLYADVISGRNYRDVANLTHWIRYDPYSVFQRWWDGINDADLPCRRWSRVRLGDRVNLSSPVLPVAEISSSWMQTVQNSLSDDPASAKSTVISATSANPGFGAYIAENFAGRVVVDETIWFFRMFALLHGIEDVVSTSSYAIYRAWRNSAVYPYPTGELQAPEVLRVRIPDNRIPNIPIFYANSNQFAAFTRNQVTARDGITVESLGSEVAVVPITSQDRGKFLIPLCAASLSSGLWNTWIGNYVCGQGTDNSFSVQFFEAKGAKVVIDGPFKAIILVVWDDAGPAAWTGVRDFGIGALIPNLIAPAEGGVDVNFAPIFYRFYGQTPGDAAHVVVEQDEHIGKAWVDAYHYLQVNFSYGNAERRAIVAAAELFHDAMLDPMPADEGHQEVVGMALPTGSSPGSGARSRRRVARGRLVHPILEIVGEQPGQVDGEPAVAAAPQNDVAWDIGDNQYAGIEYLPYVAGAENDFYQVPQQLQPYGAQRVNVIGNGQVDDFWSQWLMRASPNYYLRGCRFGTETVTPLNAFEGYPNIPAADLRDVEITSYNRIEGVPRMSLPRSSWLGRVACAMGAVQVTGSTLNWHDPVTPYDYLRNVAHLLGACYNMVIVTSGLSPAVWLGVLDPNQQFRTREYQGMKYDVLRSATFGKSVLLQAQLSRSAGAGLLRQHPEYLRRDNNLARYLALPMTWEEVAYVMNKFCSDGPGHFLVKNYVAGVTWQHHQHGSAISSGWTTNGDMFEVMRLNLMTNSTAIGPLWPTILCCNMADMNLVNERPPVAIENTPLRWMAEITVPDRNQFVRTKLWTVPLTEVANANGDLWISVTNPVTLEADGEVGQEVVWPDPAWWNWLSKRAVDVGRQLLQGNWVGALITTIQYAVRDIRTHIRTGRPAWEAEDLRAAEEEQEFGDAQAYRGRPGANGAGTVEEVRAG